MSSTYTSLHYHIIYSTKHRIPNIHPTWRSELHRYLAGTVRGHKGHPINADRIREAFERPALQYDLILDPADPGAVVFHGSRLRLSPKPYALLTLLAQRCGRTVPYTSIDEIVWPGEKVEPQQISAHKSKLIRALGEATTRERAEAAILTDPRYGLRLDLNPQKVKQGPQKNP